MLLTHVTHSFFFFLNQQFITRSAKADRGSYFCNYVQRKHTNRKLRKEEGKIKKEEREIYIKELIDKE